MYLGNLDVFLSADGSQIELRSLAELSGDKLLIKQFQEAALDRKNPLKDVHCQVGHVLTGWPVERIKDEKNLRKMCKNLHFGIVFGIAEEGVYPYVVAKIRTIDGKNADLTGITPKRMKSLYRAYFKKYTGVAAFIEKMRAQVESVGYVESQFGFRRDINKTNDFGRKTYWANQAINTPVQSTAHGFVLIALALLEIKPRTYNLLQRCLMEVHDALYFRVKLRDLSEAYRQLMDLFERGAYEYAQENFHLKLRVPLLAEATAGFCAGSMVDYEGEPAEEFLERWRIKQREVESKRWEDLMPKSIVSETV
jgi:DNA polymerase-1